MRIRDRFIEKRMIRFRISSLVDGVRAKKSQFHLLENS